MNQTQKVFGPYSSVKMAGNFYFISGQIGIDPETKLCHKDIESQSRQALNNLKFLVQKSQIEMKDVVKTTIYLTDISLLEQVNMIYADYFGESGPARATVGVAELPRVGGEIPILVEIEAVAYKKQS